MGSRPLAQPSSWGMSIFHVKVRTFNINRKVLGLRGVPLLFTLDLALALPASSSSLTIASWPLSVAHSSRVRPSMSLEAASNLPTFNNRFMIVAWLKSAAKNCGVAPSFQGTLLQRVPEAALTTQHSALLTRTHRTYYRLTPQEGLLLYYPTPRISSIRCSHRSHVAPRVKTMPQQTPDPDISRCYEAPRWLKDSACNRVSMSKLSENFA